MVAMYVLIWKVDVCWSVHVAEGEGEGCWGEQEEEGGALLALTDTEVHDRHELKVA